MSQAGPSDLEETEPPLENIKVDERRVDVRRRFRKAKREDVWTSAFRKVKGEQGGGGHEERSEREEVEVEVKKVVRGKGIEGDEESDMKPQKSRISLAYEKYKKQKEMAEESGKEGTSPSLARFSEFSESPKSAKTTKYEKAIKVFLEKKNSENVDLKTIARASKASRKLQKLMKNNQKSGILEASTPLLPYDEFEKVEEEKRNLKKKMEVLESLEGKNVNIFEISQFLKNYQKSLPVHDSREEKKLQKFEVGREMELRVLSEKYRKQFEEVEELKFKVLSLTEEKQGWGMEKDRLLLTIDGLRAREEALTRVIQTRIQEEKLREKEHKSDEIDKIFVVDEEAPAEILPENLRLCLAENILESVRVYQKSKTFLEILNSVRGVTSQIEHFILKKLLPDLQIQIFDVSNVYGDSLFLKNQSVHQFFITFLVLPGFSGKTSEILCSTDGNEKEEFLLPLSQVRRLNYEIQNLSILCRLERLEKREFYFSDPLSFLKFFQGNSFSVSPQNSKKLTKKETIDVEEEDLTLTISYKCENVL